MADRGSAWGAVRAVGPADLLALVAGPDRLAFYAEVMGLRAQPGPGGPVVDLGSGGAEAEALADLILAGQGKVAAETLRRRLPSLRVQAASAVRARAATQGGLRAGGGEVALLAAQTAHAGFFALEVLDLTHRRFDGTTSAPLRREVFVAADAVTVLPYDPVRDRVLLIEQFRPGPLLRGDPLPWQLEAIAGRIDPGETPEAAARREAVEEAGLTLGPLEWVGGYYPSPGAATITTRPVRAAGLDLPEGQWLIGDLWGTLQDPAVFPEPAAFRPERGLDHRGDMALFAPQGGGDPARTHRCPGEGVTVALMVAALRVLCRDLDWTAPEQDLSVDLSRIPARPASGVLLDRLRPR